MRSCKTAVWWKPVIKALCHGVYGDKNFTVIQSVYAPAEETEVVLMSGEMVDALDLIGFYDGNHMSAIQNGVEFSVFSDDLSLEEMMRVISSMQVAVMK